MSDSLLAILERRSQRTPDGCLVWTGACTKAGYGEINRKGKVRHVHRLAWELNRGPIPSGLLVLHRCDNPPCWNPDHLFLGTHQDNTDDKVAKGRLRHGHLYGDQHPARANPGYLKRAEDHPAARLTWDAVRAIRAAHAAGETKADLARRFNANRGTIFKIVNNQQWIEKP